MILNVLCLLLAIVATVINGFTKRKFNKFLFCINLIFSIYWIFVIWGDLK